MLLSLSSKTTLLCLQVDEKYFFFFVLVYFCLTRVNAGQPLRNFCFPGVFVLLLLLFTTGQKALSYKTFEIKMTENTCL